MLIAIILVLILLPVAGLLFFSWRKHRKDVVEMEEYFRDIYK